MSLDLFTYPQSPGWKARDTAAEAAESIRPTAARLQRMCLSALRLAGPMTADECADWLGIDKLSIRPRFSELSKLGYVTDTEERHLNDSGKRAIVWRAAR